jgi:hypothetical protein
VVAPCCKNFGGFEGVDHVVVVAHVVNRELVEAGKPVMVEVVAFVGPEYDEVVPKFVLVGMVVEMNETCVG